MSPDKLVIPELGELRSEGQVRVHQESFAAHSVQILEWEAVVELGPWHLERNQTVWVWIMAVSFKIT
jgi:hypothetical protein